MTSQNQTDANRRNAQKSTGPRTAAGRKRSSQNALKHGLCSTGIVLPGEDEREIEEHRRELYESLGCETPLQRTVGNDIANLSILMWRSTRFNESAMMHVIVLDREEQAFEELERRVAQKRVNEMLESGQIERPPPPTEAMRQRLQQERKQEEQAELGRAFARDIEGPNVLEKSLRYTTTIRRSLIRMRVELAWLKEHGL